MKSVSRAAALILLAVGTLALAPGPAPAQQAAPAPTPAPTPAPAPALKPLVGSIAGHTGWPAAKPDDVKSLDAILRALYDVISGPKGQARDWDRMRSLFIPDARLIPIHPTQDNAHADAIVLSIDQYIERASGTMSANGFFERGIHNDVQQFGNLVHVWSTYESRHSASDAEPFTRGINSIQLLKDGDRYWIIDIVWDSERPNQRIPQEYLPLKSNSY
jgi:hypothetical protein